MNRWRSWALTLVARQCFGARAEEPVGDNLCCDERVETLDLDPTELRPVAERLATEAADFIRRRREELFGDTPLRESTGRVVRAKSTPTDPVTIVDTETERLL